jgi:hypothetical protein
MRKIYPFISKSFTRILIIIVSTFCALSAFAGDLGLVFANGLGMPRLWLIGSPFNSFFWPGIILFLIVGGTNLISIIFAFKKSKFIPETAAIAGFGLQIWTFTEIYIIREDNWLQILFFTLGTLLLVFAGLSTRSKD